MKQVLTGHVSPETAYVVDDYPYGFRLRCKIRYWLEYDPRRGYRLCSQTTNPRMEMTFWNKPHKSTYQKVAAAMYLDDEQHVQWSGLNHYADVEECREWYLKFKPAVDADGEMFKRIDLWVRWKLAFKSSGSEAIARSLWKQACAHDAIDPVSKFVVFSDDNPFNKQYQEAIGQCLKLKRDLDSIKAGTFFAEVLPECE